MSNTGTVRIGNKDYHTVAKRVQDFREKHGEAYGIWTDLIQNESLVVMSARIVDKETGFTVAMGHAEEDRSKGQINRTSALENCETSAIGRALAAFGISGTEFASANEVENAIHQQNEPKEKAAPPATITDDQQAELVALFSATGITAKPIFDRASKNTGVKVTDISELPASEFEGIRNFLLSKKDAK